MKLEFSFPFLMLKSQRFVNFFDNVGKRHKMAVQKLGDLFAIVGLAGMLWAVVFLLKGVSRILGGAGSQVTLAIPGVQIPGSQFYMPFWSGIAAIFLLALVHEGMHALLASAEGIKPSSFAFLLLLFIPAAGVDLDEKKLKGLDKSARLRIFSAGSAGNFLLALIAFLLVFPLTKLAASEIIYDGLIVVNSSNPELQIPAGFVITEINGTDVRSVTRIHAFLEKQKPGDYVVVSGPNGSFAGRLIEKSGKTRLGIYLKQNYHTKSALGKAFVSLLRFLALLFQLNLGVGLINLLPLGFLDGGRMLEDVSAEAYRILNPLMLGLLLFNFVGPWLLAVIH